MFSIQVQGNAKRIFTAAVSTSTNMTLAWQAHIYRVKGREKEEIISCASFVLSFEKRRKRRNVENTLPFQSARLSFSFSKDISYFGSGVEKSMILLS